MELSKVTGPCLSSQKAGRGNVCLPPVSLLEVGPSHNPNSCNREFIQNGRGVLSPLSRFITHWQTSSTSMLLWFSLCWLLYTPCFTHSPCPLFKIILSLMAKISFWIYWTVSYETAGPSQVQKLLQVPCFLFIQKCIRLLGSKSSKDKVQAVTNYVSGRMKKQRKSS